ncbi:MAG: Bax inhibitor-1/YccA family protein [Pseudomonadota bacterium]
MADRQYMQGTTVAGTRAVEIDEGLRAHMTKIYALMGGAMIITALVAYIVGMDFKAASQGEPTTLLSVGVLQAMFTSPIKWIIMFAPLAVVFGMGAMINRMSAGTAQMVFWGFGALMGLSISWIFAVFTDISIAQTFFATAAAFGALSLYGYTTKKDLYGMGTFLFMGLIGLIIASIINIFVASSALQFAISLIGVLIFAGLTAFYTQDIKSTYVAHATHGDQEWLDKAAIDGSLSLYIAFLNMFQFLLMFMGQQE